MFRSEDEWTARLASLLTVRGDVLTGIGDDAAVVAGPRSGTDLVYTTDAVVEGVHFAAGTQPERIGHKMAGRLLSDLAAMGAAADFILLNLVVPPGTPGETMERIYAGANQLASSFGASIIGGDTLTSSPLALHGFASGRLPAGRAVLRSGARPGDVIFVTGELGGSISGKHLDFTPRLLEGIWLREQGLASAMMDISDGLARDLRRMCAASATSAVLDAAAVPVSVAVQESATAARLRHALTDGEDYELLFTVDREKAGDFSSAWRAFSPLPCSRIGVMTESGADRVTIDIDGAVRPLPEGGWDHLC